MTTLKKTDLMTVAMVAGVDYFQHKQIRPKDIFINLGLLVGSRVLVARVPIPTQIPQLNKTESVLAAATFAKHKLLDKKNLQGSALETLKLVGAQRLAFAIKDNFGLKNHLL